MTMKKQIYTSSFVILALVMCMIAFIIIKEHEIQKTIIILSESEKAARISNQIKFNTVQIQQFLTDASLVHDEESVKEAQNNLNELKKM